MDVKFTELVEQLNGLDFKGMYGSDFLHTGTRPPMSSRLSTSSPTPCANCVRATFRPRSSTRASAVSLFRDNSTRTRFSFSKAANLLGLELQDPDEKKSQIAHGETVRETATMISFMADVIGIRDDMYIGKGDAYMAEVSESVQQAYEDGVLDHRPTLISLQSDSDHPTQSSADMLYLINEFGGLENLKGKKVAVTWAYSPSYGKPLSCPQSLISLLPRFGMDVTLAHPGATTSCPRSSSALRAMPPSPAPPLSRSTPWPGAFEGRRHRDPQELGPFAAMEKRTNLYAEGDDAGIAALEKELLAQNATHQDWCSTTELMEKTANGQDTIFMHPLPADISGVSCEHGEVNADVFDMHRVGMYKEASYKPYAIAAMMFLQKVADPAATLKALDERNTARWLRA